MDKARQKTKQNYTSESSSKSRGQRKVKLSGSRVTPTWRVGKGEGEGRGVKRGWATVSGIKSGESFELMANTLFAPQRVAVIALHINL